MERTEITFEDRVSTIQAYLTRPELLAQLAEECAELGQAALKLRRALDGTNPTPVDRYEADAHWREEIGDVLLCVAALGPMLDGTLDADIQKGMEWKAERWVERLESR